MIFFDLLTLPFKFSPLAMNCNYYNLKWQNSGYFTCPCVNGTPPIEAEELIFKKTLAYLPKIKSRYLHSCASSFGFLTGHTSTKIKMLCNN